MRIYKFTFDIDIDFLFACHVCREMYRLATDSFTTDRQTNSKTDKHTEDMMPIAQHTPWQYDRLKILTYRHISVSIL